MHASLHARTWLLSFVVGATLAMPAWGQLPHRLITLGSAEGLQTVALGLNDRGDVVGLSSHPQTSRTRALWWQGTSVVDLGFGTAFDVNNRGQIVANHREGAVRWEGTVPTLLGPGVAQAINDAGQAAGFTFHLDGGLSRNHAALWSADGALTDLGTLGGVDSFADAINEAGHAVGAWLDANGQLHAALWRDGLGIDLSVAGEWSSDARGINDVGQIAGNVQFEEGGPFHAVVWNGTTPTVLEGGGSLSVLIHDMNDRGQLVGASGFRAVMWDDGRLIDLNTLLRPETVQAGWVLQRALAINDEGWIVGEARNPAVSEVGVAFLLSVSDEPDLFLHPAPIPEPSTLASMLAGLALLAACRRGRKSM